MLSFVPLKSVVLCLFFGLLSYKAIFLLCLQSTPNHDPHNTPVTHWRPRLRFYVLTDPVSFNRFAIPSEIYPILRYQLISYWIVFLNTVDLVLFSVKPL